LAAYFKHSLFTLQHLNATMKPQEPSPWFLYYSRLDFKEEYEENIFCRALDFRPFLEKYLDEILEEV
jgi:hypothetical protein